MLAQVLVSGIGIWLTYLLGKALFSEAAGVFGAMVMAVDPLATWCAQVIMPDTLFATLVTGGALLAVLLLRRPAWLLAAGLGTVLAVATLVKPVIYYLPVPLCIMLWLGRVPGKMILGVLAPVALLVGGWQVRNLTTVGTAEFSGIQGINLLVYRAGSIVSKQEHIPMESAKAQLVRSLPPPSSLSAAEMNRVYSKAATKIIAAHALVVGSRSSPSLPPATVSAACSSSVPPASWRSSTYLPGWKRDLCRAPRNGCCMGRLR
jgi:hypothetical protein